jgi:hypothetical protein
MVICEEDTWKKQVGEFLQLSIAEASVEAGTQI